MADPIDTNGLEGADLVNTNGVGESEGSAGWGFGSWLGATNKEEENKVKRKCK